MLVALYNKSLQLEDCKELTQQRSTVHPQLAEEFPWLWMCSYLLTISHSSIVSADYLTQQHLISSINHTRHAPQQSCCCCWDSVLPVGSNRAGHTPFTLAYFHSTLCSRVFEKLMLGWRMTYYIQRWPNISLGIQQITASKQEC